MKLYHVTKLEYLANILEKGLIPHHGKGIGCNIKKSQPKVWLTDNVDIPKAQLGSIWNDKIWVILEVDISNLDIVPYMTTCYPEGLNKHIMGEWVVFGEIPPTKINPVDFTNTRSHAVMVSTTMTECQKLLEK